VLQGQFISFVHDGKTDAHPLSLKIGDADEVKVH